MIIQYPPHNFGVMPKYTPNPAPLFRFGNTLARESKIQDENGNARTLIHHSFLFRDSKLLQALPTELAKRFPEGCPMYCYASSDGSEPYSVAIALTEKLGKSKAQDFFPLQARDISLEMVSDCQKGKLSFNAKMIRKPIGSVANYFDFVSPRKTLLGGDLYRVKPELRQAVSFEQADLLKAAKKPFDKPCVLFFRNAWYLTGKPEGIIQLAQDLFKNLKPGSLLVVGAGEDKMKPLYLAVGFRPLSQKGPLSRVYERPDIPERILSPKTEQSLKKAIGYPQFLIDLKSRVTKGLLLTDRLLSSVLK